MPTSPGEPSPRERARRAWDELSECSATSPAAAATLAQPLCPATKECPDAVVKRVVIAAVIAEGAAIIAKARLSDDQGDFEAAYEQYRQGLTVLLEADRHFHGDHAPLRETVTQCFSRAKELKLRIFSKHREIFKEGSR